MHSMHSIFTTVKRELIAAVCRDWEGLSEWLCRELEAQPPLDLHDEAEALLSAVESGQGATVCALRHASDGLVLFLSETILGYDRVFLAFPDDTYMDTPKTVREMAGYRREVIEKYPGLRLPDVPRVRLEELLVPPDVDHVEAALIVRETRALVDFYTSIRRTVAAADRHRKRAAKRRASEMGLAYWPALVYGPRIDPRAYLIAEEEFEAAGCGRWGDGDCHGGWDAKEVWGASAYQVAEMWRAAGCRDSVKFRLMLRAHIEDRDEYGHVRSRPLLFGPRWGLKRCHDWLRGRRWAERYELSVSSGVARTLGRLPPHLRWAAVARASQHGRRIRARDLDWDAVRAVRDAWRQEGAGALRCRAAAAPNIRRAAQILGCAPRQVPALLAPAFPTLAFEDASLIAMGHAPRDLVPTGIELTARDAHEWCRDGAPRDVVAWFAAHNRLPPHRSMRVLRWMLTLRRAGRWATLLRPRRMYRPEGVREIRLIDIIDEVDEVDIRTGSDSAARVMERVEARLKESRTSYAFCYHRPLARLPEWARTLPRWVRLLRTPAELDREGEEMRHCVGSYVGAVERGECHILSIRSIHGRSTVELTPHMEVRQHKGVANGEPPRRHDQLLRAWLRRLHRQPRWRAA